MKMRESKAAYAARKIARHVQLAKTVLDAKVCCEECRMMLVKPVTGPCGHTMCVNCIQRHGGYDDCDCKFSQKDTQINILAQTISEKMQYRRPLPKSRVSSTMYYPDDTKFTLLPASPGRVMKCRIRSRVLKKRYRGFEAEILCKDHESRRMSTIPEYRMQYARNLLIWGRYRDATGHLAQVAGSTHHYAKSARSLLIKVIETLCPSDPMRMIRSMYKTVRFEMATAWIDDTTIECPVCYEFMENPVTTVCGHTFCRNCIERTLNERDYCPLCSFHLCNFNLSETANNPMISALLTAISANSSADTELIPVFACTVAFPEITCPLMILDAEYRKVVRAVLDLGLRRFGMLASLGDDTYSNYGTIVDVRDYIELENGNCILSTVGMTRFRIINKMVINGCPYARVKSHTDALPMSHVTVAYIQSTAKQLKERALQWIDSVDESLRHDISQHFGPFPEMSLDGEWWRKPNGPCWLWWLIAILPLRAEIQMLMLSTRNLKKRMSAILRTLDAMNTFTFVRAK